MLGGQFLGLAHHAAAAFGGGGQDHFRAVRAHQLAPLDGEGFHHGGDELVTARGGHQRQGHAGVAGSGFHDGVAGLQQALGFRVQDDGQCQAVLDRAAGIERFDLRIERDVRRGDAVQFHHRGAADGVEDAVVECHGILR